MEITRESRTINPPIPVQFSKVRIGNTSTVYNVQVGGLTSLFESLPESTKIAILEAISKEE